MQKDPYSGQDKGTGDYTGTGDYSRDHSRDPYGDDYEYIDVSSSPKVNRALEPLISQIHEYDSLRLTLEQHGGNLTSLNRISEILSNPFLIIGHFHNTQVTLMDHASIYSMLNDVGNFNLHLDIRQLDTGMPVYYLCRSRQDYWAEYSLIVQDLYISSGYPMPDERFVRLMRAGHEAYYLRLSHFRQAVANNLVEEESDSLVKESDSLQDTVDDILYNLGRHVFQAAWHEDQRLAVLVSAHFGLENFRHCIELLYLCLSAELCELRLAVNEQLLQFFDQVYPQPAIRTFLDLLTGLDGGTLNAIPQKALGLYTRLSRAFSRFLGIEVNWGYRKDRIPLYKLIYGNFSRMDLVARELKGNQGIEGGAVCLEAEAQAIFKEIMNCC